MTASHSSFRRWRLGIVAGVATGALALAGCTDGGGGGGAEGGGGVSVPYGAPAADFQAALADMEPVNLVYQSGSASATASGGENSVKLKEYIEEMSGGKITVEIAFAYGIAGPAQQDDAIGDGRIDLAQTLPIYEPSEYPAASVLIDTTMLNPPGMVFGLLAGGAATVEYGWREPAFAEELAAAGNHMVVPLSPTLQPVLACKEPMRSLADFEGKQLRGSGEALTREMEALGGVPVEMPLTEIYEGMQRGIVDCSTAGFSTALGQGFIPLAPYMHYSDTVSLPLAPGSFVWSDKVEGLPLAARQLLFDAIYLYTVWSIEYGWDVTTDDTVAEVEAANGEFIPFDAESDAAIAAANEAIVDNLAATTAFDASELRPTVEALQEKWAGIVAGLGVEPDGPLGEFNSWYTPGSVDLDGWLDALYEEVLNEYRPA